MNPRETKNNFGLNEMEKVSLCSFPAFIPRSLLKEDEEMLNKLKAAVYSLIMGLSLPTAYKHIKGHRISEKGELTNLIDDAKNYCNKNLYIIKSKLSSIKYGAELNYALIGNTLVRLEASYEAAIFLAAEGFNFETKAIARMIVEQLSYAYQVSNVQLKNQEEDIIDFYRQRNIQNTNISGLKSFLPHLDLGRLYNSLTEHAHFDKKSQWTMFKLDANGNESSIYLKSSKYSFYNFFIIIALLEATQVLIEYVFRNILQEFTYINYDSHILKPEFATIRYEHAADLLKAAQELGF